MAQGVELATAWVTLLPSMQGMTSKIAKGVGDAIKIASAAAAAGTVAAVGAALNEFANYEQLIGGMETLYGEAADTVIANAENAFRTAGMSANEYMETVTSFSASLINSVGGDTERAAALADQALQDMSDNANRMGTDMESIQNAYRGFARGQFQLLDNLSLGYAGTKSGMEQLLADAEAISGVHYDISSYADIVEAINVVQTEMGITGATAQEAASTISGSIASTQAAWTNLITHLADENADIPALLENLFSSATNVIRNVGQRIPIILTQLMQAVPAALSSMGDLFAPLVPALLEMAPGLLQAFTNMVLLMVNQLPMALPQVVAGAAQLFQGLLIALIQISPQLVAGIAQAIANLSMELTNNAPAIFAAAMEMLNEIWHAILAAAPTIVTSLANILAQLIANLANAAPGLFAAAAEFIRGLPSAIGNVIGEALTAIQGILDGIANAIKAFDLIEAGKQLIQGFIDGVASMASAVFDAAVGAVQGAIDGVLGILGIASPSKLFHQIGEYTMEGFAEGIDDASSMAMAAMDDATAGITASVNAGMVGAAAGGVSYYIYFNDTQVNDTPAIRREVDDFVLTMLREADQ